MNQGPQNYGSADLKDSDRDTKLTLPEMTVEI